MMHIDSTNMNKWIEKLSNDFPDKFFIGSFNILSIYGCSQYIFNACCGEFYDYAVIDTKYVKLHEKDDCVEFQFWNANENERETMRQPIEDYATLKEKSLKLYYYVQHVLKSKKKTVLMNDIKYSEILA